LAVILTGVALDANKLYDYPILAYTFYGDTYLYEFPTGSGNKMNLKQIANESKRLFVCSKETQKVNLSTMQMIIMTFYKEEHFKNQHFSMNFLMVIQAKARASHQTDGLHQLPTL
jgi:hypothetical protein